MWRSALTATFLLFTLPAEAREAELRVVVRFAPHISGSETARFASAIRGQLRDTATVDVRESEAFVPMATCIVDIDRTEAGFVLHLADGGGRAVGAPRIVARGGEVGASEVATIVRAFVVVAGAARETAKENDAKPGPPLASAPAAGESRENRSSTPATMSAVSGESEAAAVGDQANGSESPPKATAPPRPERGNAAHEGSPDGERARAPWRARLAALYTGTAFAPELPWQSGGRVEGAYAFLPGLYAGVTYAFYPARQIGSEAVSLSVTRHSAALFAGLEGSWRTFVVGADAAIGLDDTVRGGAQTSAAFTPAIIAAVNVGPTLALRLHGRWPLLGGPGLGLDVAPTVELATSERRMVVEGERTSAILTPTLVRFRLDVGVTFDGF